jgi:hypothetical protein
MAARRAQAVPLRDHFRPPVDKIVSWEGFHGGWPMVIVQNLHKPLPPGYRAAPRVHLGSLAAMDVAEYEVRIYDARLARRLVAAIEIVCPANKDRPEHRNRFVAKCAALLQEGIAVSIIDLVTVLPFNLYVELLAFIGHDDPTLGAKPPRIYAATCRAVDETERTMLQAWSYALTLGQPLPTLPLWLSGELAVPLDLDESYETTCRDLRIP